MKPKEVIKFLRKPGSNAYGFTRITEDDGEWFKLHKNTVIASMRYYGKHDEEATILAYNPGGTSDLYIG